MICNYHEVNKIYLKHKILIINSLINYIIISKY